MSSFQGLVLFSEEGKKNLDFNRRSEQLLVCLSLFSPKLHSVGFANVPRRFEFGQSEHKEHDKCKPSKNTKQLDLHYGTLKFFNY